MQNDNRPPSSTATSLIARLQAEETDAWERLCRLYGPLIFQWAQHSGLQAHDASDVMQEVFQALSPNLEKFRKQNTSDSFRGWLWTITRNKVRDFHRRKKSQAVAAGGSTAMIRIQEMAESPASADSIDGQNETTALWRRALQLIQNDFERNTWQAFWRTVVKGEKPNDVAADLLVSTWTVYKARSRVLQRLREEFDGLMEG